MVSDTPEQDIFIAPPASGPLPVQLTRAVTLGGAEIRLNGRVLGRLFAGLSGFYPETEARARDLASGLDAAVGTLVLLIHPYVEYLPALWREQARRRAVPDFAEIAPVLADTPRGWPEVVKDLRRGLSPRRTVVLATPFDPAAALETLCPTAELPAPAADKPAMPDTALAMLQRLHRQGVMLGPRQRARLLAFHERQPQPAALAAFAPSEAEALRVRYDQDLGRIAALRDVDVVHGLAGTARHARAAY